ncbi:hypothetical protein [Streptomyces sp. NPDC057238]|uniref:hypothetical protein n=1 Tax=Streptomyces sp. NPDC057238 TaxID=3346060 RepID=UPI00363447C4
MAVAARLVPDGSSLLQGSGRKPGRQPTEAEHRLYDEFFAVRRGRVCRSLFTAQFLRRLAQVMCDVGEYGFDGPDSNSHGTETAELAVRGPALLRRLGESLVEGHLPLPGWPQGGNRLLLSPP